MGKTMDSEYRSHTKKAERRREMAAAFLEALARDDSHGYDQQFRWGERGDYDCSSAVITAWQAAGVPVKGRGASYTGNMRGAFLRCGFQDVTAQINLGTGAGLVRGDVLLNLRHHTALSCGNGMEVEASINEHGGVTGGQPGDQSGREFLIRPYRNYPWDCVLRYMGDGGTAEESGADQKTTAPAALCMAKIPEVRRGDAGAAAAACQAALRQKGCDPGEIDGDMGARSEAALRRFQAAQGLDADGICGAQTWTALLKG